MNVIRKLGVFANCLKPRAGAVLGRLEDAASSVGIELVAFGEAGALIPSVTSRSYADGLADLDAMIVLGGDGTMLAAVRALAGADIPLMGVNIGSLGFMTSLAEENLEKAILCLHKGRYVATTRSQIQAALWRGNEQVTALRALNDLVVTRGPSTRVVSLALAVDGDPVNSYICDGLIVATPTGSTGHSLSAGGPILMPDSHCFVASLICPHTLSSRPLVIPDSRGLSVTVVAAEPGVLMSVDGQVAEALEVGDMVEVTCAPTRVRFLHLPDYDYFDVLRQKLHWTGSHV
jgi:NAD+ kinase